MKYQKKASGRSKASMRPQSGQWAVPVPEDRSRYLSTTSYTPERITAIMNMANTGDTEQLCICAREILERNWDIIGAMEQRSEALCGVRYDVTPGGKKPEDKRAADAFAEMLESCGESADDDTLVGTFHDLVKSMTEAVIYPFTVSEIVWAEGGSIESFQNIEPWRFTLRDSFKPRLICDEYPNGMELPPGKFIVHQFRKKSDPARGGLIRTLVWLHMFQNWPMKDLMAFVERFGMPFVVAKVDKQTWDQERSTLHKLIRSFGPSGGGVFTSSTELELLQAANTGSDNVYFKILEYTHDAIYTLLLGQTASSSDGGGLSKDDAQSKVRQDILEADARSIEATIRAQIAARWIKHNFPNAAPPKIHFAVEPPEDTAAHATTVQTLYNSGFQLDPTEVGNKVGYKLKLKPEAAQTAATGFPVPAAQIQEDANFNLKQKYDAMGVAIRAGLLTASPEIEAQTRAELGMPQMSEEVRKAWEATGGIRPPITLKGAEAAAVNDALNVDEKSDAVKMSASGRIRRGAAIMSALENGLIHQTSDVNRALSAMLGLPEDAITFAADDKKKVSSNPDELADETAGEVINGGVLDAWLGPLSKGVTDVCSLSGDKFIGALAKLAEKPPLGDSAGFEKAIFREAVTGLKGEK